MELDSIDAQVLDSMADDYYGLWEVADYFAQLLPAMGRPATDELCRSRMKQYVKAGFVNVFVGNFGTGKFQKVSNELALLDDARSWQTPTEITDGVAATTTSEAEGPVAKAWPK